MEALVFKDSRGIAKDGTVKCTLVNIELIAWAEWVESSEESTEEASKSSARIFLQGISNPVILHGKSADLFIEYVSEMTEAWA